MFAAWVMAAPSSIHAAPAPRAISGGAPVAGCGWPSVGALSNCTATLVHPRLILFAAHCGPADEVRFGEDVRSPSRTVGTVDCQPFPGATPGQGTDLAYCLLDEPQPDIPIVPVIAGCEAQILRPGIDVTVVGFGETPEGTVGVKHAVTTTMTAISGNDEAIIGGDGQDACGGDSGGPALVQLPDGSWRVFAVVSYGDPMCREGGAYALATTALSWLEASSGVDVTPCHRVTEDAVVWDPTARCAGLPRSPAPGGGSWADGCPSSETVATPESCGPPFDREPDTDDPIIDVVAPRPGDTFVLGDDQSLRKVTVVVEAHDDGWGLEGVTLLVDGQEIPRGLDEIPPYRYEAGFPVGDYALVAVARDHAGRVVESDPIAFEVAPGAEEPTDEPPGEGGCAVGRGRSTRGAGWSAIWFAWVVSLRRPRR